MLGEEYLSLSLQQVCSLISSDKLTVSSEEKVRDRYRLQCRDGTMSVIEFFGAIDVAGYEFS